MTIHHDKMAYGKIASVNEEASQEQLQKMAQALNAADAEGGKNEICAVENEICAGENQNGAGAADPSQKGAPQSAEREYDRMIAGKLYNPADEELTAIRRRARKLVRAYNETDEEQGKLRAEILDQLFGSHGSMCFCEPPVRFDYGINLHVGEDFFANFNFTVLDCAPVRIGKQCFIGPNVSLLTPVHPFLACDRNMRRAPNGEKYDYEYAKPIIIGDNVWLAGGVTVCGGVTIGHDTVIGAGSVVTRDIPSGVLAAGNPCRVIRPLSEKDKLEMPR